jgi:tRNA1(Val) A37 N6-methylase TrmN6
MSEPTEDAPGSGETLDRLAGEWWIYQLRRGHRYATDDVLTAWTAWRARPRAGRVLDLGSGVGALGLMTLLKLGPLARLVSVEAQVVSARLLARTLERNGLTRRAEARLGDVREPGLLDDQAPFDLVVSNPPFLPAGAASASPHPQRALARLELRGDVFDFCRAAARQLTPAGRFCFCHAAADPRPEAAVAAAGLSLRARQEVIFRQGRRPVIALYEAALEPGPLAQRPPLVVRRADGERAEGYRAVRRDMLIEA